MTKYLAHITELHHERVEQPLKSHLLGVATYAADKLSHIGLHHTAYLAGLLHDMGKYTAKYQDYLERATNGENVARGSVNHTFCGCVYLLRTYHTGNPPGSSDLASELLAYAVGAHHGQFDCVTPENTSGFEHRLNKDAAEIGYDKAVAAFLMDCAPVEEIDRLFSLAQSEIITLFQSFVTRFGKSSVKNTYLRGLTARMLLSAVIDGDRRDTAEFMRGTKYPDREGSKGLWAKQIDFYEKKIAEFDERTPINRARSHFSDQCRTFAQTHGSGIYRLTLPTGGGKTLAALRYGLYHAKAHGKKRILFVIPLLSILEQNSTVLRDFLRDKDILIEHHSNVVKTFETGKDLDRYELMVETWNSPIIVTTLVQLLNTLFSSKTTAVRRMSALCDTVIVIDEIQSLPKKTTHLFTMALNFLSCHCGATIVLSSATQPCFDETDIPIQYAAPPDIVPYEEKLFEVFRRTAIVDKTSPYGMSPEELVDFSTELFERVSSLLLICNTKESARTLYTELKRRCNDCRIFHLSAAMCPAHRADTLSRINAALKRGEKTLCVSTQLVEAGVDFSFEAVIRVAAGMDNLAQAAGRCNRNNEFFGIRSVYIVNLNQAAERLSMLWEIETAQRCTKQLLQAFARDPARYGGDLLSQKSLAEYYRLLFSDRAMKDTFDYPQKMPYGEPDTLFNLLSENKNHTERAEFKGRYFFHQAFQTAGKLFQVFDEATTEVVVPYREGKTVIADLFSERATHDDEFLYTCIEKAKPYTVRIFAYQNQTLREYGMLSSDQKYGRFTVLDPQCYHDETGLTLDPFIS